MWGENVRYYLLYELNVKKLQCTWRVKINNFGKIIAYYSKFILFIPSVWPLETLILTSILLIFKLKPTT
jgi:hypothetical protein